MERYLVVHDLGTSSAKASLYTTEGELIASASEAYQTYCPDVSRAEQDPEDWWRAFCRNNEKILKGKDPGKVACVSFSTAFPNLVLADGEGKALGRAILWQDTRAAGQYEELKARLPERFQADPGLIRLMPDRCLPVLLWIKEQQPEVYKKARKMLPSNASYIILKLTGRAVTDYGVAHATAMICHGEQDWCEEILRLADIPRGLLPELMDRSGTAGAVSEEAARECHLAPGTTVICGGRDFELTAIGGGLLHPGDVVLVGGTSAEIKAIHPVTGRSLGRPTTSSGASLRWMRDTIGLLEKMAEEEDPSREPFELINEKVAQAPPGSHGVLFLPYLSGERGVRNDPFARGAFTGVSLLTTREDLMRAVVEGIGFNLELILQEIRNEGIKAERIPVTGGLGKGETVRQIFADILGAELITFEHMDQAACAAAAVVGGIGLGLYEDMEAVKKFMRPAGETLPDLQRHELYQRMMPRFDAVYRALKPVYAQEYNL